MKASPSFANRIQPSLWAAALFSLFCLKLINLNVLFGLPRINGFIDPVFQLSDVVLLAWLVADWSHLLFSKRGRLGLGLGAVLLILPLLLQAAGFSAWLHFGLCLIRLMALLSGLYFLRRDWARGVWAIAAVIILYATFDHLLLTSGLAVLMFYMCAKFKSLDPLDAVRVVWALGIWLAVNAGLAIFQVFSGHSLGLGILGEPLVSLGVQNVAKQTFGSWLWLRGYGLTLHPNILGYCAVIAGLVVHAGPSSKAKVTGLMFGMLCVILSFSRLGWIAAGGLTLYAMLPQTMAQSRSTGIAKSRWVRLGLALLVPGIIAGLFVARGKSDVFRLADLVKYFSAAHISPLERMIGLGLGQYPFWLQASRPELASWEWQPVHSLWLNLLIELGLVGTWGLCCLCWLVFRAAAPTTKAYPVD